MNDILIATDGSVYLACGVDGGFIVRLPAGGGAEREATFPMTRIVALAEAPGGFIWAAGAVLENAGENSRPMLWERSPLAEMHDGLRR